jgi:uncharacterized protein (TIGR03492 family)
MRDVKLIFLSNGYGEDTISTYIIRETYKKFNEINDLKNNKISIEILAFPLVNDGQKYKQNNIKVIGPTKILKSSGISGIFNIKNFVNDINDGLISFIFRQLKFLEEFKNKENIYLIAVGDIYPLFLSVLKNRLSKKNVIFIPTAKSYKTEPFNPIEIYFMSLVNANFVRDELTYLKLKNKLNNVYFVGNPVLDIEYIKPDKDIFVQNNVIILPGRKSNCLDNLHYFIKGINLLLNKSKGFLKDLLTFSIVIPDFYPIYEINNLIDKELDKNYKDRVYVLSDKYYRYLLENSYLVWGQAGSGNEQAAGYGLPVISFNENNWYRKRQKKLLNNCLILVKMYDIEELTKKTIEFFINNDIYKEIQTECYKEMGSLGGATNIANYIINNILL